MQTVNDNFCLGPRLRGDDGRCASYEKPGFRTSPIFGKMSGMKIVVPFFLLFLFAVVGLSEETAWEESPYRVRIYVSTSDDNQLPREFFRTVRERCAVFWGEYWIVQVQTPSVELRDLLRTDFAESSDLPKDWTELDKIFVVDFSSETLQLREFDVATRRLGKKFSFSLGNFSKFDDVLIQGFSDIFSPLGRVEQSDEGQATLSLRGHNLLRNATSVRYETFLPFVRVFDRSAKLTQVDQIPWTVLVAESKEMQHRGLRCRVESGIRAPLSVRRRGRTEIYALSVPTPSTATLLQFVSRSATAVKRIGTLPLYDVYEKLPGEKKPVLIGKSTVDGTFLLEPSAERAVRLLQVRDGTTLIAQFPVIRGVESQARIPVPDDVIRLEAEAALLGIQEEMIDQVARRDILNLRAKKFEEQGDTQRFREIRSELLRMKDANRYHLELNQLRERLRSDDPIVDRRINRLFNETNKMVDAFLH